MVASVDFYEIFHIIKLLLMLLPLLSFCSHLHLLLSSGSSAKLE